MSQALIDQLIDQNASKKTLHENLISLREFFDAYFYKGENELPLQEALTAYVETHQDTEGIGALRDLSPDLLTGINQENCFQMIQDSKNTLEDMPTIHLTTAIKLTSESEKEISKWFKKNLKSTYLIETKHDSAILGGCIFTYQHKEHDYSLGSLIEKNQDKIANLIREKVSEVSST